ncbi:MAG: V4R domain-containing protein [Gemmatimonadales bacterium]
MTAPGTGTATTGLTIGQGGLRQLHRSLLQYAPDAAIAVLQETGYASGEGVYQAFAAWLIARSGIERPEDLDAAHFSEVLSEFFQTKGWGSLTVAPMSGAALSLDSVDWIEAEPGTAQLPMCFFSAGMLADFLGRVSGEPVAVMEVECRSKGDPYCRFLSASPATLQEVYEQMTQGRSYQDALGGT